VNPRLKRLYADLRHLKALTGLDLQVYEDPEGLLLADRRMIWCLIAEFGPSWEISFNEFTGRNQRAVLLDALRRIIPDEALFVGNDTIFVSVKQETHR